MTKLVKNLQKTYKKHKKALKRYGVPVAAGVFIFTLGVFFNKYQVSRTQPSNIVWAADTTVKIPKDLRRTLEKQNTCRNYRGNGSPDGVGIWGVIQVEKQNYAKVAYGCSLNLTNYMMAVKKNNKWLLLPPTDYFSDTAQGVPKCTVITTYAIPQEIESFCTNESGSVVKNPTPDQ